MEPPKRQLYLFIGALLLIALLAVSSARAQQDAAAAAAAIAKSRLQGDGTSSRFPFRFRRETGHLHKLSRGQLAALNSQAAEQAANLEQSLVEADEQTLKRQLPELIARAHNDKTLERALLRLVISASLRGSNVLNQPQQQFASSGGGGGGGGGQWQLDSLDNAQNNLAQYNQANSGSAGDFGPVRLARLEPSELVNLESQLAGELPELAAGQFGGGGGGGLSSPMDKREYTKPCSFNAISCVRTPFRKFK